MYKGEHMKLSNVIKGHKTDNYIIIHDNQGSIEWKGIGIYHMIDKYCANWFNKDVHNVTKDRLGRTHIYLK